MRFRRIAIAMLMAALLVAVMAVPGTAAAQTAYDADTEFVSMMIPHHHQALVMSEMAPTRSTNSTLLALASRIDVEQAIEINTMQQWQAWNGLQVTNAEQAYQQVLQNPAMLEQMGMATPAELAALSAASGTAFDALYLELMIEHHEGALDMLLNVMINGSDFIIQQMAGDMYITQYTQILQMEQMLADLT
jgi:uncharacterized protein (DUF305 family)